MSTKSKTKHKNKKSNKKRFDIHSPFIHAVMYGILLFLTPFIMLRNFLQEAIGSLSHFSITLLDFEIPIIVLLGFFVIISLTVIFRKHLTVYRIVTFAVIIFLWLFAQKMSDYYFNHKFYELQHNWHYIAYSLFVLLIYRACTVKGLSSAQFALIGFFLSLLMSIGDETLQVFISNRIF